MKRFSVALLANSIAAPLAQAADASPIGKVIQMLSDLQTKVIREGEDAQKVYQEFSEWCEDRARDLAHEIKTGNAQVDELKASIGQSSATISELTAKIDDLAGSISSDEADLKAAKEIRGKEKADFQAEESELVETSDMVTRAVGILEREMAKGGAAMVQVKNARGLAAALSAMVDASMMSTADAKRLTALVQTSGASSGGDAEDDAGAPSAAVYESQSGDIVETLHSMLEKAETQLDEARKTETKNVQAYEMLEQSIRDELRFANKEMDEAKKGMAQAGEAKATAEGDLSTSSKDLKADVSTRADLHQECMGRAEDFEVETKSRGEELAALAKAKEVITEATGGADAIAYGGASFVQTATRSSNAGVEAAHLVRDLGRRHGDQGLALLAERLSAVARSGAAEPFAKIKGLIGDMIEKLESAAAADADHKAYCDKELKETNEKKDDKSTDVEKLSTKIDQMKARSSKLKEEVAALQQALSNLASSQAEADKLRATEKEAHGKNKAELEQGLQGVKMALQVLSDYYAKDSAHGSASGASSGIIGLLEVCESDFSKNLAEVEAAEEAAVSAYEQETKDGEVERAAKSKDVEYKVKESARLDKDSASLSADRQNVQAELDAILEYSSKLHGECSEEVESYAEKKAKREAEIAGLKEAFDVLESETAFVQRRAVHRRFRGTAAAALEA